MVLIICRISGCPKQKELSLEDQEDGAKELVRDWYSGPVKYRVYSTIGKGESRDRPELAEIREAYRSGLYDLVVIDDLSRLIRGADAASFLGLGKDHGTRTVCIQDGIDTDNGSWEVDALNACSENVAHNEKTSKRVKTKTMNRFKKDGWTPRRPIASTVAPEGATSFDEWFKLQDVDDPVHAGRKMLLSARKDRTRVNYTAVADYFKSIGFKVGEFCRKTDWDGAMVKNFYSNPLLMGVARRGVMHNVKKHEAGRRKPAKNPDGPEFYDCPHLAILSKDEFDDLQLLFKENALHYKKSSDERASSRLGIPRKSTRYPGQHARCWYCGRFEVWGGNGRTRNLMCNGARSQSCWNSFGFNGALATQNVVKALFAELDTLQGFDDQFQAMVHAALTGDAPATERRRKTLADEERELKAQQANVRAAILASGGASFVLDMLKDCEAREARLAAQRRELAEDDFECPQLPESVAVLRGMLNDELAGKAHDSPEFGLLLQNVVESFHVYLVRLRDGGGLLPRARVTLAFDGIAPDLRRALGGTELLRRDVTIDLFVPPQRARIHSDVVELSALGHGPKAIAALIAERGKESPTATAVQHAIRLERAVKSQGADSLYEIILAPPEGYTRMRRHKHRKYKFEPLEGYVPPTL
ncbi:MAG: recombinase family protein [Planctomycetaceae bacterium]|nr:recombinase family protein [Planctomycetaceae bacterium]